MPVNKWNTELLLQVAGLVGKVLLAVEQKNIPAIVVNVLKLLQLLGVKIPDNIQEILNGFLVMSGGLGNAKLDQD